MGVSLDISMLQLTLLGLGLLGSWIAAFGLTLRYIMTKAEEEAALVEARLLVSLQAEEERRLEDKKTVTRLHTRLDELSKEFVRREEILGHMQTLERSMNDMRTESNQRLDRLYSLLIQQIGT